MYIILHSGLHRSAIDRGVADAACVALLLCADRLLQVSRLVSHFHSCRDAFVYRNEAPFYWTGIIYIKDHLSSCVPVVVNSIIFCEIYYET